MAWTERLDALPVEALAVVVFLAAFLETIPPVGLVVPGQSTIVTLSFLAGRRGEGWPVLVAAVTLGAVAGDLAGYVTGRRTGLGFLQRLPRRLRPAPARLAWLEQLFRSHGVKTVLAARFQPLTRCFAPLLAGATRMAPGRFVAASVAGALVASAMLVALGYLTGLGFERIGRMLGTGVAVLGVLALAAIVLIVLKVRRERLEKAVAPHVREADWDRDEQAVAGLLRAYFAEFASELGRQDFDAEVAQLRRMYGPPDTLLVADAGGEVVGCVGLKARTPEEGEVKRMVVDPAWRGTGVGRLLGAAVVAEGRQRGFRRLVLDTTPGMAAARSLYARLGFRETAAYYDGSPLSVPVFMELPLE